MKKLFFIAAIASAALVSCTKNELAPSVTEQQEISFSAPVVGVQTKVYGAIESTYDTGETFDVWSVYNVNDISTWGGTPYFSDVTAAHDNTANGWKLATPYYWPVTGKLSFVALSPSLTNTTTYDATYGFKVTAWNQGANESAIVDLLYSDEALNKEKAAYGADGEEKTGDVNSYKGVDITFKHALSYIVFKVKTTAEYTSTQFRLNSITLSGIYTTGNFTQKPASPGTNWEVDTTPAKVGTYEAYSGALTFGSAAVEVPETDKEEIILLPQALTTGQQKITVEYEISTDGKELTDDTKEWISQTQTVDLKGTVTQWGMGMKYTYTLSIGMQEIIFDPAVSTWTNADGGTITF